MMTVISGKSYRYARKEHQRCHGWKNGQECAVGAHVTQGKKQMFRVGIVETQDAANYRVRVKFPDHNQLVNWWLPIVVAKSQNDKSYHMPDVGEQVVCLYV